jgi:hypothetical protein
VRSAAAQGGLPTVSNSELEQPLLIEPLGEAEDEAVEGLPSLRPLECIRLGDFWLLWIANAIGSGAGLAVLNNLGQQARRRIPPPPRGHAA